MGGGSCVVWLVDGPGKLGWSHCWGSEGTEIGGELRHTNSRVNRIHTGSQYADSAEGAHLQGSSRPDAANLVHLELLSAEATELQGRIYAPTRVERGGLCAHF